MVQVGLAVLVGHDVAGVAVRRDRDGLTQRGQQAGTVGVAVQIVGTVPDSPYLSETADMTGIFGWFSLGSDHVPNRYFGKYFLVII